MERMINENLYSWCGNGGTAVAAELSLRGHEVTLIKTSMLCMTKTLIFFWKMVVQLISSKEEKR